MSTLNVVMGQINPTVGDIEGNVRLMEGVAARNEKADLIVFPELSLCGYYPGDLLREPRFMQAVDEGLARLSEANARTDGQYWVVGLPIRRLGPGKPFSNHLLVLKNGKAVLGYSKQLLPTYDIFDEARHFEPGPAHAAVLTIKGYRVGFLICEDGWVEAAGSGQGRLYSADPVAALAKEEPDLVVSINASPAASGKRFQRHALFADVVRYRFKGAPLIYVNQVGGQDQTVFDGASFVLNGTGEVVAEARCFEEDEVSIGYSGTYREWSIPSSAMPKWDFGVMETYRRQIVLGLRDYARRCGFKSVVVGSSGGIDSALTLALAVEAMGPENVIAITMPSEYSSAGSVTDSKALCDALGVRLLTERIRPLVDQHRESFQEASGTPLTGLALENLQARIRGTILMAYSNSFGHLLLTTGNKSELAVGYCTLYGDTNGGLNLIGDLYKTEVFELAKHLNRSAGRELIPNAILTKAPSAELAPGQKDSDSLPDYPILDAVLKTLIEGEALREGEKASVLNVRQALGKTEWAAVSNRVSGLMSRSEYKRRQSAPVIKVRAVSFGPGRQMPIAATHWLGEAA